MVHGREESGKGSQVIHDGVQGNPPPPPPPDGIGMVLPRNVDGMLSCLNMI